MPPAPSRFVAPTRLGIATLLLITALARPAGAAADTLDRKSIVEQQRKQMEATYANLPELKHTRVQDLFTLRLVNKGLSFNTPLYEARPRLPEGQLRARLDGLDGLTLVQTSHFVSPDQDGNHVEMRTFVLTHYDYSDPEVVATLSVQAEPNYFHVDRTSQLADGFRSVRLTEQRGGGGADQPGMVSFAVNETSSSRQGPISINVHEPDFATLLRNHPNEIRQYLRPLLRSVSQEHVFQPDALVAWQVFADRWKSDPKTVAAVDRLLPRLNAADYATRDAATAALKKLGRPAVAVLLRADRAKLTPEQNTRVDGVLSPYTQLPPEEAQRLRSDAGFLLDCLYCEDADIRVAAVQRLAEVAGKKIQFDTNAATAERWAAVAALRQQLFPAEHGPAAKS